MQTLEGYFNPHLAVKSPPQVFHGYDWYKRLEREMVAFVAGYLDEFGADSLAINEWFRIMSDQESLLQEGKTVAKLSEHIFAAALDIKIPDSFRSPKLIDFFGKIMRIDPRVRIGWLSYCKDDHLPTFFHAGWGYHIPFDTIREVIGKIPGLSEIEQDQLFHRINQCWRPGARW